MEKVIAARELFKSVAVLKVPQTNTTSRDAHVKKAPVISYYFNLVEFLLCKSNLKKVNSVLMQSFDCHISLADFFLNVLDCVFDYFMIAATLRVVELTQK